MKKLLIELSANDARAIQTRQIALPPGVTVDMAERSITTEGTLVRLVGDDLPCEETDFGTPYPEYYCVVEQPHGCGRRLVLGGQVEPAEAIEDIVEQSTKPGGDG